MLKLNIGKSSNSQAMLKSMYSTHNENAGNPLKSRRGMSKKDLKIIDEDKRRIMDHLNQRLKKYNSWVLKLRASQAFLNEKKFKYINQWNQIASTTDIHNPNDIESLSNIIDRTGELTIIKEKKD